MRLGLLPSHKRELQRAFKKADAFDHFRQRTRRAFLGLWGLAVGGSGLSFFAGCKVAGTRAPMQPPVGPLDATALGRILEPLTQPTEISGRRVRGLRPWAGPDQALLEAIGRGEFIANGFRNRDLVRLLHPRSPTIPRRVAKQAPAPFAPSDSSVTTS